MNYNAFQYEEVTTPAFTESHLGCVLVIFIWTRGIVYHFVVEVSLFANLRTLWIIAIDYFHVVIFTGKYVYDERPQCLLSLL